MRKKRALSYDFNWKFEHDWVRDGIPWFVLPASQTEAETYKYNQNKLNYVRSLLRGTNKNDYLKGILDNILSLGSSAQENVEAIICFVQDATWHNPLECPIEADNKSIVTEAHELLELHDARCWHTSEILRQLFVESGWEARLAFLPSRYSESMHVIAEVLYEGVWHFTDANYFKNHVIVKDPAGKLPTLEWLRMYPHYVDRYPGGWTFSSDYLKNMAGVTVTGQFALPFAEAINTWGSDSYYCYYLGAEEKFPPIQTPYIKVKKESGSSVRISWGASKSKGSLFIRYNLEVRRKADAFQVCKLDSLESTETIVSNLVYNEEYCVTVQATDEHIFIEPLTWYPSSICMFTIRAEHDRVDGKPARCYNK